MRSIILLSNTGEEMSLIIKLSSNEVSTMVLIVEKFLKEIQSNSEKLSADQIERKAHNKQLDEFIFTAINETIAKNNTYRIKNPNANLDSLFDMDFSESSVGMYKESIAAFLDQVKNTEVESLHPEHIARSKRLLEAFDSPVSDKK